MRILVLAAALSLAVDITAVRAADGIALIDAAKNADTAALRALLTELRLTTKATGGLPNSGCIS